MDEMPRDARPDEQTFLFADLAGFTALTEAHGDEHATDLVEEFSRAAGERLPDYGAEQVKAVGDALMLRVPDASAAVWLGCSLTGELMADHGYPAIRVGMHHGSALRRRDDWFGATVNLAARISGLAGGGDVLLSEATRLAAGELDGLRYIDRGTHRLRNIAVPVRVFAATRKQAEEPTLVIDPVCRMAVDPERSAGKLTHDGRESYFCSLECVGRFAAAPGDYTG